MKQYIEVDGLIFKEEGWTDEEYNDLVDGVTGLAESYGSDVQAGIRYGILTEKEVEKSLKQPRKWKILKALAVILLGLSLTLSYVFASKILSLQKEAYECYEEYILWEIQPKKNGQY